MCVGGKINESHSLLNMFRCLIQYVVASITRSDVAEQSGEMARSLSGPVLRYDKRFIEIFFFFCPSRDFFL